VTEAGAPIDIMLVVRDPSRERRIVARNAFGDEKVLFRTNRNVGPSKRDRVESELRSMPFDEWCARYRVTEGWCRGDAAEVALANDPRSTRRSAPWLFALATAFIIVMLLVGVVPLGWEKAAGGILLWAVVAAVSYPIVVWRMKNTRMDHR
jgi:hypothetical protein